MKNLSYVCVMLIYLVVCEGYKILLVFPVNSKSHRILADGYIDSLLKAGHVVTFVTPHPRDIPGPNLTQIDISDNIMKYNFGQFLTLENILDGDVSYNKYKTFSVLYNVARGTMENVDVQRLLNDPEQHFDLVIAEWLFSDFYAGFSAVFNCPYIWAVSMNPSWLVLQLVEAARNPEYYPDMHSGNNSPFSLPTRFQEFTRQMHVMAMKKFIFDGLERQLYEEKIVPILRKRGRNIPELVELVFNASLLIVNSHVTLAQIMTLPPNCVTVGGYHIDSRIPPLPKDLQTIMDEATHGVIYFSMGTILSSETFPKLMIQGLLNMFKGLKQVVLWKFNNVVADLPSNVQILRWAPQQSILNHPNCALFITHGGYLSITEAVHFGVPVVAIPVFADQFANVAKLRGIGKKVDLTYNLVDDLEAAIAEVIANTRYKERMEHLSLIYHDQKSPRQRLVDWVEYVIRTGGAPHLRSPAILMPWYQQLYLDLLVLILFVVFLLFVIVLLSLRLILN